MTKKIIQAWVIALALAAGLVPLAPAFGAQDQGQSSNAQQQSPNAQQQPSPKQVRTYLGEVVKTRSGKYGLLTNKKTGEGYFLDDQKDAQKYDQQNVLVTGTVDPQTSTLHVRAIKPAPQG